MKLKDMKIGIRYKVVKGSKRGALRTGDRIWIEGGILMCQEACGWIDDWSRLKDEVELDVEYYNKIIKRYSGEIDYINGLIRENEKNA